MNFIDILFGTLTKIARSHLNSPIFRRTLPWAIPESLHTHGVGVISQYLSCVILSFSVFFTLNLAFPEILPIVEMLVSLKLRLTCNVVYMDIALLVPFHSRELVALQLIVENRSDLTLDGIFDLRFEGDDIRGRRIRVCLTRIIIFWRRLLLSPFFPIVEHSFVLFRSLFQQFPFSIYSM